MAAINSANMAFPFSSRDPVESISKPAILLLALSPLFGWAVFILLSLRIEAVDRLMMFLFVFPFGAHLLLPLLFHAEAEHRTFMRQSPVRFYFVPLLLAGFMIYGSFEWMKITAVLLAMASGFHIGMQHFGLMRLIDWKLELPSATAVDRAAEKAVFLICAMLPTSVFSLKILRLWSPQFEFTAMIIAAITALVLAVYTIQQRKRKPWLRLAAMWSFALLAIPWAFYYRFDFNEGAFLVAGVGHSLQYFVCYRLFLSGKSMQPGREPNVGNLKFYYVFLFLLLLAVEWAAFENFQRNFLTSLIWALSAVHIYYDSMFWKNSNSSTQASVMQPLYAGLGKVAAK